MLLEKSAAEDKGISHFSKLDSGVRDQQLPNHFLRGLRFGKEHTE